MLNPRRKPFFHHNVCPDAGQPAGRRDDRSDARGDDSSRARGLCRGARQVGGAELHNLGLGLSLRARQAPHCQRPSSEQKGARLLAVGLSRPLSAGLAVFDLPLCHVCILSLKCLFWAFGPSLITTSSPSFRFSVAFLGSMCRIASRMRTNEVSAD
eukprot:2328482-Rhodomonas_salina.3